MVGYRLSVPNRRRVGAEVRTASSSNVQTASSAEAQSTAVGQRTAVATGAARRPGLDVRRVAGANIVRLVSLIVVLVAWEQYGKTVNPVLFTYPTAIAAAFLELTNGCNLIALLQLTFGCELWSFFQLTAKVLVVGLFFAVVV